MPGEPRRGVRTVRAWYGSCRAFGFQVLAGRTRPLPPGPEQHSWVSTRDASVRHRAEACSSSPSRRDPWPSPQPRGGGHFSCESIGPSEYGAARRGSCWESCIESSKTSGSRAPRRSIRNARDLHDGTTVLIADSDPAYLLAASRLLATVGCRPFTARSEFEVLALLGAGPPIDGGAALSLDVCLIDDRLRGRPGLVAVRAVLGLRPRCAVAVLSSLPEPSRRRAAHRHGAVVYARKPISSGWLLEVIRRAREERREQLFRRRASRRALRR